jgi:hypothetical protein
MPKKLRCLDDFRRAEIDMWSLADDVADDVRDLMPPAPRGAGNENTGAKAVLEEIAHALAKEGIERKAGYLRKLWETSDSWTPEDRFPADVVPFAAHSELRSLKWPNRREIIAKLLVKHHGRVSQRDVIRYRQEQTPPKPALSWQDENVRLLSQFITRRIGDRRSRTVAEARRVLSGVLRDAAAELDAIE